MLITPAVRALARAWPAARIDFVGSATSAEVFCHLPFVSGVRALSKKRVHFLGWFAPKTYDLALVYGYDGDGPFVEYALRVARKVIAFTQRKASLNERLFAAVDKPAFGTCHMVDHFLSLIRPLGIPNAGKHLSYVVAPQERAWAETELASLRANRRAPLIGLQVASYPTRGYRDWPIGQFIELCQRIVASYPRAYFLVLGGSRERERTAMLGSAFPTRSSVYAGRLSLRQTAALMDQLDLYIGVDTGPTHIMGALHRPMVALYHPHSPSALFAPLEHPCLYVVDHPAAGQSSGRDIPMGDITVDQVWSQVERAMKR